MSPCTGLDKGVMFSFFVSSTGSQESTVSFWAVKGSSLYGLRVLADAFGY